MANTFTRKPNPGGDVGAWAPFNDAQNNSVLGIYTCNLYDDSGALKITTGWIGIDDGTNKGVSQIDTITTISLAAVSNSNWAKIEMTVSGTTVTFAAADISGATDSASLPSDFTDNYNGEKGGFYITSTKRCIGLAWKNAGGTLEGIVNTIGNSESYVGYSSSSNNTDRHNFTTYYGNIFYNGEKFNKIFQLPKGRWPSGDYSKTTNSTQDDLYEALNVIIPNINDEVILNGVGYLSGVNYHLIKAIKNTASSIILHRFPDNGTTVLTTTLNDDDITVVFTSARFTW